jgi:ribosomal protein S14
MSRQLLLKNIDNYKRKFFLKNEIKNKFLNIKKNSYESKLDLEVFRFLAINSSTSHKISKINNKCVNSGRNQNIFNKFKLSRFELRTSLKKNEIAGVSKK